MVRLLFFRWLGIFLLGLVSWLPARASHVFGGDISYSPIASTTVGVPRYHVVVRQFYNANVSDVTAPGTAVSITASRAGCGAVAPNAFTVQVLINRNRILTGPPTACPANPTYLTCYFEVDMDLPAGQWLLSTNSSNRSNAVNIQFAAGYYCYLEAYLDNTMTTQNTSPKFESVLLPILGPGAVPPHSFSAYDIDGDSLRYETILPLGGCNSAITSSTLSPHFQVNASLGAATQLAAASTQGYYDMAVRVSKYRRLNGTWQLLGSVMRDQLYLINSTTNQPPTFTSLSVNGVAQPLGQLIRARPGQTLTLLLTATDPDAGQLLRFATEAPNIVPGLTLTTRNATQVQLTWQVPTSLRAGRYYIPLAVLDNGCPYSASEERTLAFLFTRTLLPTSPPTNP